MPRKEDGLVADEGQSLMQGSKHLARVATGKVRSPTAVDEEGVPTEEAVLHEEALTPRRMAGRGDSGDRHLTNRHHVAVIVRREHPRIQSRALHNPRHFGALYVYRHVYEFKEFLDAGDVQSAHQISTDVVSVEV